jgi:hypothetical protein
MSRRTRYDPLQPLPCPTWLVTRDKHRCPLESREITAGADLRAVLHSARADRIAAGWVCDDIGRSCGFFFAEREGERLQISIERYDSAGPGPPSHCDPVPSASKVRTPIDLAWQAIRKPGTVHGMKSWKLQYRPLGRGPHKGGEQIFLAEADFLQALQTAYRNFGAALSATLPDGTPLTDTELRERYPPQ